MPMLHKCGIHQQPQSWFSFCSRPWRRHQQATMPYSPQQPQSWDCSLPLAREGGTNRLSQRTTQCTMAESLTECPAREDHPNHLGAKKRHMWSLWRYELHIKWTFCMNTFMSNWNVTVSSKLKNNTLWGLVRPFFDLYVYVETPEYKRI